MNIAPIDKSWPAEMKPQPHELNGLKRGHFCKLKTESGTYFWAMVTEVQRDNGSVAGRAEDSFPGGPDRGDMVVFDKRHIHEVI